MNNFIYKLSQICFERYSHTEVSVHFMNTFIYRNHRYALSDIHIRNYLVLGIIVYTEMLSFRCTFMKSFIYRLSQIYFERYSHTELSVFL